MNTRRQRFDREHILSGVPPSFWKIPYDPRAYPGSTTARDLLEGANCQRFAYAVLGLFGLHVPPFRSSDLWTDPSVTLRVHEPEALDLVLLGGGPNGWGAHVGVYLGDEEVLHLCKEVGEPAVWSLDDFKSRRRYRRLVGFKRVLRGVQANSR